MRIRLLVIGDAPPGLAEAVKDGLLPAFEAVRHESVRLDLAPFVDSGRAQVDALRLLDALPPPAADEVVLAVTDRDLFAPSLAYVLGLSPVGGRLGLVSWARLRPDRREPEAAARLARRLVIEAMHEIGHALSLVHCPVTDCAMHRSFWPEAVDLKEPAYCRACNHTLAEILGRAG